MTPPSLDVMAAEIAELKRWRNDIDRVNPSVLAERVKNLNEDVKALKKALYTFAFTVAGSAVLFAFTVFALLGKGAH
jgi:hypothetical protein